MYNNNNDIYRIKDVIHSLDQNHWDSKRWLAETFKKLHIPNTGHSGKINVLGGWYGLTAHMLRQQFPSSTMEIISSDVDPFCEEVGRKLFKDSSINFQTFDMFTESYEHSHAIVSTSAEHVDRDELISLVANKDEDTWVVLQSNNFFNHPTHINCSESVDEFKEYLAPHIDVYFAGVLPNSTFDRYMVIGK